MSRIFEIDGSLVNLDLNYFDTGKVQNISKMFNYDANLKSLKKENFNTINIINFKIKYFGQVWHEVYSRQLLKNLILTIKDI